MSLSEADIMGQLRTSLGLAIQSCRDLAVRSEEGSPYEVLRNNLVLIEGCCRQMAVYRDDTRWLPFGMLMANIHQRAGNWLRGYSKNGVHIIWTHGHLNEAFVKLGAELTIVLAELPKLATKRTGRTGPILPDVGVAERRTGRPALDNRSKKPNALILPPKYRQVG